METLPLSGRLDPLKYSSDLNVVFSNRYIGLRERLTYVIQVYYSRGYSRISDLPYEVRARRKL